MKTTIWKIQVLLVPLVCVFLPGSSCPGSDMKEMKHCVVNLDEPALTRWNKCITQYKSDLKSFISRIRGSYGESDVVEFSNLLSKLMPDAKHSLGQELAEELKGIAKAIDEPFETMVFFAIFFEVTGGCTSVVVQDADDSIYLARNLDFSAALRNIVVNVDFKRNDKTLFKALSFVGYPGVLTGFQDGRLATSYNQRVHDTADANAMEDYNNFVETIKALARNMGEVSEKDRTQFITWELRKALQNDYGFAKTVQAIEETKHFSTPGYVILAGIKSNEGAVIIRNRNAVEQTLKLDVESNKWYLNQTNVDMCTECNRCVSIRDYLNTLGRYSITPEALFKGLAKPPVLQTRANFSTLYSTVMNPAKGIFENRLP